jgi:hypothetical protein
MANIYKNGVIELHELLTRAGASMGANMLIPDLQRPYVWTPKQVTRLLDSLIRGWPFGTLLMWKVTNAEFSGIPSRPFWSHVDRTEGRVGAQVSKMNPPSEYQMVLDGQQRVQSLLLALGGDDWGFKQEDRAWTEELTEQRPRGRQAKNRHWSKASLCLDLHDFLRQYRANEDKLVSVDFETALVWAVTDSDGQSKFPKPLNYSNPIELMKPGRHLRLSRIWSAVIPDASLMERNFKTVLRKLLPENGFSEAQTNDLIVPMAELMVTLRDVKLAKVAFLELQPYNSTIWTQEEYNEAVVSIFTRLNSAGRPLSKEEITLAWLKVGWESGKTGGQSTGECFDALAKELKGAWAGVGD